MRNKKNDPSIIIKYSFLSIALLSILLNLANYLGEFKYLILGVGTECMPPNLSIINMISKIQKSECIEDNSKIISLISQ